MLVMVSIAICLAFNRFNCTHTHTQYFKYCRASSNSWSLVIPQGSRINVIGRMSIIIYRGVKNSNFAFPPKKQNPRVIQPRMLGVAARMKCRSC